MTPVSPRPQQSDAAYTITVGLHTAQLQLNGDIDLTAVAQLTRVLHALEQMPAMMLQVDMSDVTFLDSSGVRPLVEAARRRRGCHEPPLLISQPSRPAQRLLEATCLGVGPRLNLVGWDQLAADPTHSQP